MWSNVGDFVSWLANSVINPMINMMRSVDVLGFTLFEWIFGISVVALGVRFLSWFWDTGKKDK